MTPADAPEDRSLLDWAHHSGATEHVRALVQEEVKGLRRRRSRLVSGVSAAVVLAFVAFGVVPWMRQTATTATLSKSASLTLGDGSLAELSARTRLHTDFRYGRRVTRLDKGEAYFSVRSDPAHPFFVETPAGEVRVTGTKFNVRLTPQGAAEVTLFEGHVAFAKNTATPLTLNPGEQLLSTANAPVALTPLERERATAWRENRFLLAGLTLGEATARFAAYHDRVITVDSAVANLRPGGSCPLDDIEGFLGALRETLPVEVLHNPDGSVRLIPR